MSFISTLLLVFSFLTSAQESPQTERQKNIILQGYLGLMGPYKTLPAGLSVNYNAHSHFMLTAEYAIGSNSFIFDGGRNTETFLLGFKYFPKAFEYSRGRLYYRFLVNYSKVKSETPDDLANLFSTEDWKYRANALSTTLSIGYQQIYASGLTFSFDLIGVHVPISENFKDEEAVDATSAGLMRDNQKNLSEELSLTLLWFYIGMAF